MHKNDGGYLWSPKRNANGARNPFYESIGTAPRNDGCADLCEQVWYRVP